MARFTKVNEDVAREIISRYPVLKSAVIPLCHLAQEQDGYLTDDAMEHIAELLELTPAEVLGTASFYEMFKLHPVGKYVVNVCTSISCFLNGGDELLEHAEKRLGTKAGGVSDDGLFFLEGYECIAACTEAPCLQVNYRYFHRITNQQFDRLINDLRSGNRPDIPPHPQPAVPPLDQPPGARHPPGPPAAGHAGEGPPAHPRRSRRRRGAPRS